VVVVVMAASCSTGEPQAEPASPKPTATDLGTATVSPGSAAQAEAGNFSVAIPVGAVSTRGTLTLERDGVQDPKGLPAHVEQVGPPATVTLAGTQLTGEAELRFQLDEPGGDDLVVVWEDPGGGWRWLPTELRDGGRSVIASTDHFSTGFLARINVEEMAREQKDRLVQYLSGRSDVSQPGCGDEQALRDAGVEVASDRGDSVKWCVGIEAGRNVLKIANNRRTYTQITYPDEWEVLDGGPGGVSLDALVRAGASWLENAAALSGTDVRLLSGGDTLTLAMPDRPNATVTAEVATGAWLLSALKFGIFDVYLPLAGAAKSELGRTASTAWERFLGEVNAGDPTSGWNSALSDCLRSFTDEFTDQPDLSLSETAPAIAKFSWSCVPAMMKADLEASGVRFFGFGVVVSAVGTVTGAVLTAVHLITTGAREIWDTVAKYSGDSDGIYDIWLRTAVESPTSPSIRLGQSWASSQAGFGEVQPSRISYGGDPLGIVEDIEWADWGEERALGQGTGYFDVGPTVADARPSRATVVAWNLGTCPGAEGTRYRSLAWFFPDEGETEELYGYTDICTGDYVER
jgi:hypothetical protein